MKGATPDEHQSLGSDDAAPEDGENLHSLLARPIISFTGFLVCALLLLVGLAFGSLFVGSGNIPAGDVVEAILHGGNDTQSILVLDRRVPRMLLALVVGVALGVAGAIVQAITRNPLADPGILGVNAGAYLAIVIGAVVLGSTATSSLVWLALVGALIASVGVFLIGTAGPDGTNPVRLVLTGVAIGAIFNGASFAISLRYSEVFDRVRYWQLGSLQGRQYEELWSILPFVAVALVVGLVIAPSLNILSLGDELASGLGAKVALIRATGIGVVTVLCGAATAAVGPISFLGLMVPHLLRSFVGPDQRKIVVGSAIVAPALFLSADMIGRVIAPVEIPVGIPTAVLGACVLVLVVRSQREAAQ